MAEDNDPESKTEEPSDTRLREAREKGDVAKSPDAAAFLLLVGAAIGLNIFAGSVSGNLAGSLMAFLEHPHTMPTEGPALEHLMATIGGKAAFAAIGAIGIMAMAGIAGHVLQTGLIWAPKKLSIDITRLSPAKGWDRIFGKEAFGQFGKSILKVAIFSAVVVGAFAPLWSQVGIAIDSEPMVLAALLKEAAARLFIAVLSALGVWALVDFVMVRQSFMARMRMTREEVKEEYKQQEGDPMVKARLRQIRLEKSRQRMIAEVPKATVVVMNPTHFAVALKYDAAKGGAPICVAKGVDRVALKIREVAEAADVPVIEDPPLARALFAAVDIDDEIPLALYEAAAKVIGYVMRLDQKRRRAT